MAQEHKQLIVYGYKSFISKHDRSQRSFKGFVKVLDTRFIKAKGEGDLKFYKVLSKDCISVETALRDAEDYAKRLKRLNSKYVNEDKIKILKEV